MGTIGDNVKRIAAEKKIPLQRLAKIAGVTRSSIYKVLADEMAPSPEWLGKIAKGLKIDERQLVTADELAPRWFHEFATAGDERTTISFRANYYDLKRLRLITERRTRGQRKLMKISESSVLREILREEADRLGIVVPIRKIPK